jgi:hypothetical protein
MKRIMKLVIIVLAYEERSNIMVKELNFPMIALPLNGYAYGGNQEWFHQNWQRMAGCGCTAATNILSYYAMTEQDMALLYNGDTKNFQREDYVAAMNEMYRYMRPGIFGYPYIKRFSKQFIKYCKDRGVIMEACLLKKIHSKEEAFHYIQKQITAGNPVAVLILLHRAKQLTEHTWHWVTITGFIDESNYTSSKVILSNYGKRELVDADILFEKHRKNRIRMVSFHKCT